MLLLVCWICWVMLAARLVSCVAPPLCQNNTRCSFSSLLHSPLGEYLYTVAGVPVAVDVVGEQFSIALGGHSVDPRDLPRYGSPQYYREVHVQGAGNAIRAGELLSALNIDTARLELRGWRGAVLGEDVAAALPGLVALELSGTPGNTTELRWGELPALRELTATDAILTGSPPPTLTVLHVDRCRVFALPASLRKLQSHRSPLPPLPDGVLSLHVTGLPPPAGPLPRSLVNLTLDRLPSSSLPSSLPEAVSSLLVTGCSLVSVPDAWISVPRPRLARLRLHRNLLSSSPARGARLPALVELDLSHNKLSSLQPGDFPLPALTDLKLDYNLLQTLSGEVLADCLNLRRLRVTHNRLAVLDVGGLPRGLLLLDAGYNLFTELTGRELAGRPGLVLDYGGNPVALLSQPAGNVGDWAELRLRAAPLHCGAALLEWTKRAGPALSRVTAACRSPPALAGISLVQAPQDLYQDEVPEGCPGGCSCVLRPRAPTLLLTCNMTRIDRHLTDYRAPPAADAAPLFLILEGDLPPALALPESVARLELRGAELAGIPPLPTGLRELDVRGARAARGVRPAVGLSGVRALLMCDCDMLRLVGDAGELKCGGNEDADTVRETCARGGTGISLLAGVLAGAAVVMVAACWTAGRYRRRPPVPPPEETQYDAFVSFAHEDRAWVCHALVPRLEESGARLCLHSRDWLPGGFVPAQIDRSVRSARVTLLVASPHFARSPWAGAELTAALQGGRGALLLLLPDAPLSDLLRAHPLLARRTHLHTEDPHFWHKLQRAVLPPRSVSATRGPLARLLCCPARPPVTADDVSYKKSISH